MLAPRILAASALVVVIAVTSTQAQQLDEFCPHGDVRVHGRCEEPSKKHLDTFNKFLRIGCAPGYIRLSLTAKTCSNEKIYGQNITHHIVCPPGYELTVDGDSMCQIWTKRGKIVHQLHMYNCDHGDCQSMAFHVLNKPIAVHLLWALHQNCMDPYIRNPLTGVCQPYHLSSSSIGLTRLRRAAQKKRADKGGKKRADKGGKKRADKGGKKRADKGGKKRADKTKKSGRAVGGKKRADKGGKKRGDKSVGSAKKRADKGGKKRADKGGKKRADKKAG